MGTKDDEEEMRSIILANSREWNGFWAWRDKPIGEHGIAAAIFGAAGVSAEGLVSRPKDQDPPDCEGWVDGQWSGVEVTELVHEPTLRRSIKAVRERAAGREPRKPEAYFVWEQESVLAALRQIIPEKDAAKPKGGPYSRYVLLIHSGEYLLEGKLFARSIKDVTFHTNLITEVYVGLSYEPASRTCPVFALNVLRRR